MPEPAHHEPDHIEPGRPGGHAAVPGERRAPLAGAGQLPGGRSRPVLPRAGGVHAGGEGGVPQLRGAGRLPRVRAGPRREVRDLGRPVRAGAPPASVRQRAALERRTATAAPERRAGLTAWRGGAFDRRSSGPMPRPRAELVVAALQLGCGHQPDQLRPRATARPRRRERPVAHRARTRSCSPVRRARRGSSTPARARREARRRPERPHAGQPAVALADSCPRCARRELDVVVGELAVDRHQHAVGRRPRSRPSVGCGAAGRRRACARRTRRGGSPATCAVRGRRRRRGTRAPRASAATHAANARAASTATRRRRPSSATNGTTSSAPRRGCTPSCSARSTRCGRLRARAWPRPRSRRLARPASVNTERWWSASVCTSSSARPQARGERVEDVGSRPSDTFGTHSSTPQLGDGATPASAA